ncbi:pathogen-related protein isoform X1 [Capsicum annuum]|uniref:pathogen-related protein isoform X1 n=1 Tax=Capsicum annuum TaxID=4072 RepID=UPI001FB17D17|nr:pathogen-related protein isoform X1 [Capsicum annuum]
MTSSAVGGGDKYRDYLSDEEVKNTKWRNGPPSYDVVDKLFEEERTRVWAEGSLEEKVQRLLKTWEMEIVHKADPNDLKTVDPNKFTISINGRKGLTPAESAKLGGSYNIFLQTSLPENLRVYNPDEETFESSQKVFRSIFLRGFAIEILHVYSGPPEIVYKFRHWGYMEGPFKGHAATGQLVELFGIGTFEVLNQKSSFFFFFFKAVETTPCRNLDKESNKIIKAEMFFDRGELLGGLVKGESNGESTSGMTLDACPFMK